MTYQNDPHWRVHWWAYCVAGLVFLGLAFAGYQYAQTQQAAQVEAATSTGPELVDLSRFSPDENLGRADEVNLAVQVDEARITDLTPYGGTGVAFLLSGARDEQSLTSIRGAIIAPSRDHAQIYLETRVLGTGVFGTLYHVNGSGLDAHPQAATLENAMDDLGLVRTAEFTFVEPYYAGRDAAFAPKLNWPLYAALACLALGLFLVAYGFRARTVRRRMREAAAAQMALHFDRLGDNQLIVPAPAE